MDKSIVVMHATVYSALGLTHADVTAQLEVDGVRQWVNVYSGDWPEAADPEDDTRWFLRVLDAAATAALRRAQEL